MFRLPTTLCQLSWALRPTIRRRPAATSTSVTPSPNPSSSSRSADRCRHAHCRAGTSWQGWPTTRATWTRLPGMMAVAESAGPHPHWAAAATPRLWACPPAVAPPPSPWRLSAAPETLPKPRSRATPTGWRLGGATWSWRRRVRGERCAWSTQRSGWWWAGRGAAWVRPTPWRRRDCVCRPSHPIQPVAFLSSSHPRSFSSS